MKNTLLVLGLAAVCAMVWPLAGCEDGEPTVPEVIPCTLQFVSPDADFVAWRGTTLGIRWEHTGAVGTVLIRLALADSVLGEIASVSADNNYFPWLVDDLGAGGAPDFSLLIDAAGDTACFDRGPSFRIAHCSITMLKPVGRFRLNIGDTLLIQWESEDAVTPVDLELVKGGRLIGTIAENEPGSGLLKWAVHTFNEGTAESYVIRARSPVVDGCKDTSDYFGILDEAVCRVAVTAPTQFQVVTVGENLAISWSLSQGSASATVDLYDTDGFVGRIATDVPGELVTYDWSVSLMGAAEPATQYFIRVTDTGNSSCWNSSAVFIIQQ